MDHALFVAEAAAAKGTPGAAPGLTSDEAARLLREVGPNALVPATTRSGPWTMLKHTVTDPMVVMLMVATPIYFALGDRFDAVVTLIALVPVVAVGLIVEGRADRALEKLAKLTSPTARVLRDGSVRELPATGLVPADVIALQEGDVIPADARLLSGTQLTSDESALTGESQPVEKSFDGGDGGGMLAGTLVVTGRAMAVVTATGARTEYGRIGTLVARTEQARTPLQRTVDRLFGRLALGAGAACLAVTGLLLLYGQGIGAALIAGVSLAIAAMPEEFPMAFTLFLTMGAYRLSRQSTLVRKLAGVETLGSTTVICTDKTGTLTLGQMDVSSLTPTTMVRPEEVLAAAVLASEPQPFDPLEKAIVAYAEAHDVRVDELHAGELVTDYPFDATNKYMSHVWRHGERYRICAKGSVEGILRLASATGGERERLRAANEALAGGGQRVIAVAAGDLAGPPSGDRATDEASLHVLGLVALSDPIRPGVAEALAECRDAGIRVVMITGDHAVTAHAVADALGLPHDDAHAVTGGDELDAMSDEQLQIRVAHASIFSRTRPEQKHRLVEALQRSGNVVAMTGDGVNDAPALRRADIGVAMGRRGTQVAREAATLVLLDDNFATIVAAVREGRRVFENLRRVFAYLIAFHVPIVLLALLVPLLKRPLLLLPIHLVLLELVLHPTIALVFEGDPPSPDLMKRPPRPRSAGLTSGAQAIRPVLLGLTLTGASLGLYLRELHTGSGESVARAMGFATLILGQIVLIVTERSPEAPAWRASYRRNRPLPLVMALAVIGTLAGIYVPPFASVLHMARLSVAQLGAAIALALVATVWSEGFKRPVRGASERGNTNSGNGNLTAGRSGG